MSIRPSCYADISSHALQPGLPIKVYSMDREGDYFCGWEEVGVGGNYKNCTNPFKALLSAAEIWPPLPPASFQQLHSGLVADHHLILPDSPGPLVWLFILQCYQLPLPSFLLTAAETHMSYLLALFLSWMNTVGIQKLPFNSALADMYSMTPLGLHWTASTIIQQGKAIQWQLPNDNVKKKEEKNLGVHC